ncbi:MAG: SDR family NAD(P)-dependent oxidoreductase [Caldimonas sp.]
MEFLARRTAVITGAASGIGLGLAHACASAGMRVALLDIQRASLQRAERELGKTGAEVFAVVTDVSDAASVESACVAVHERFGKVHLLANNAGVAIHGLPIAEVPLADWDRAIAVNLMSVVHGVRSFLPRMRGHGEAGHILNTASIGGLQVRPGLNGGAYSATKYAVVAISESLRNELAGTNIGVSVLCPGAVRTGLARVDAARPERFGAANAETVSELLGAVLERGADPAAIGELALRAVREGRFFVVTHPEQREWIAARHAELMEAFGHA